jgi:hypothetical protein
MALVGYVDAISRGGVAGWAVDAEDAGRVATVAILVNGQPLATAHADQPRPGLAASTKGVATDQSGFYVAFDPPLSAFHEFTVTVVDPATRAAIPGGTHTLAAPTREAGPALTPFIVTATGGEAITHLVGELARHPAIVAADRSPYETRQIAYHAQAFAALTAASSRLRDVPPDTALAPRPGFAPGNPYNTPTFYDLTRPRSLLRDFYERRVPARYAALFRDTILEFYDILRLGQGKAGATYLIEKGDLDDGARQAARLFFPRVKELVVVRDPRDILALALTHYNLPEAPAMAALRATVAQLAAIQAAEATDTLVLRHEDLILEPVSTRRTLGLFLGLDLPLPDAAAQRFGEDPAGMIGRWQNELSAEQAAECEAAFADFFAAFDYRPAEPRAAPPPPVMAVEPPPPPPPSAPATVVAAEPAPPPVVEPEPTAVAPIAVPAAEPLSPPPPPAPPAAAQAPAATGLVVLAEGAAAVAALRAAGTDLGPDGQEMTPVAKLEFGRGNAGAAQLGPGWSKPEPGYVWSNARQAHLALPPLREAGTYRVWIAGAPSVIADKLTEQRVTVLVNTAEVGTVALREPSVIGFDLPIPVDATGGKIALTFRLPDAARPCDLSGSADDRLLGFSLRWATVLRTAT